jgi:hypothetical protein
VSSDLTSLHKILKDKTRRKIITLLDAKGCLGYTDLMNTVGVASTGALNYHLKILGDLLEKNETGQYMLSEKGKVASRLLVEFPEQDYSAQAKKTWWKRFWVVAIVLDLAGLLLVLYLNILGYLDFSSMVQGVFSFILGIVFLYFFYRMIRPVNRPVSNAQSQSNPDRTVEDIFVSGRSMQEVNEQIKRWINEEGIIIEAEREGFFRGRLGIPSGLGLTAPKYFEVSFGAEQSGVKVHTEGWISLYDVSERGFTKNALAMGSIPRRKGWAVIERLWILLRAMAK